MAKTPRNTIATNATSNVAPSQDAETVVLNTVSASDPSGVNGPDGTNTSDSGTADNPVEPQGNDSQTTAIVAVADNAEPGPEVEAVASGVSDADASQGAAEGAGANASLDLHQFSLDDVLAAAGVTTTSELLHFADVGQRVLAEITALAAEYPEFAAWHVWHKPADIIRDLAEGLIALKEVRRSLAGEAGQEEKRTFIILGDVRLDGVLHSSGTRLSITQQQHEELASARVCHSDWNVGKGV